MIKGVVRYIPVTIVYITLVVLIINYFFIQQLEIKFIPVLFLYIILLFIFFFSYGYFISTNASIIQCNKKNKKRAIIDGLSMAFQSIFIYLAINFFLFLRDPFFVLFGNTTKAAIISEIFYLSLNLVMSTISIYFNSAKNSCKIPIEEIDKKVAKLDKQLDINPNL